MSFTRDELHEAKTYQWCEGGNPRQDQLLPRIQAKGFGPLAVLEVLRSFAEASDRYFLHLELSNGRHLLTYPRLRSEIPVRGEAGYDGFWCTKGPTGAAPTDLIALWVFPLYTGDCSQIAHVKSDFSTGV
jgi:hypothetical protein